MRTKISRNNNSKYYTPITTVGATNQPGITTCHSSVANPGRVGVWQETQTITNVHLCNKDIVSLLKLHFQNAHHIYYEKSLAHIFILMALRRTTSKCPGSEAAVKPSAGTKRYEASTVAPEGSLWVSLTAWRPMTSCHTYILNSRNRAENYPDPP